MVKRQPQNIRRAYRVMDAAVQVVKAETLWSLRGVGVGSTAVKRELKEAVDEYLRYHHTSGTFT